MKTDVL